jgi:DNA polymerase
MRFINRDPKKITEESSTDKLRAVKDDVVQCIQCELHKTRKNVVVGAGNHDADIMIVGEAPGEEEDKLAMPFVGPAGNVLSELLASIGLKREDIYICNTVKCRPPQNADPTDEQKNECSSYLTRQIEAIQPKVIVCLGNHATKSIMELFGCIDKIQPISKIHGQTFSPDPLFSDTSRRMGEFAMADIKIMPLYHPAAQLHNATLGPTLRSDFKKLKEAIEVAPHKITSVSQPPLFPN